MNKKNKNESFYPSIDSSYNSSFSFSSSLSDFLFSFFVFSSLFFFSGFFSGFFSASSSFFGTNTSVKQPKKKSQIIPHSLKLNSTKSKIILLLSSFLSMILSHKNSVKLTLSRWFLYQSSIFSSYNSTILSH